MKESVNHVDRFSQGRFGLNEWYHDRYAKRWMPHAHVIDKSNRFFDGAAQEEKKTQRRANCDRSHRAVLMNKPSWLRVWVFFSCSLPAVDARKMQRLIWWVLLSHTNESFQELLGAEHFCDNWFIHHNMLWSIVCRAAWRCRTAACIVHNGVCVMLWFREPDSLNNDRNRNIL